MVALEALGAAILLAAFALGLGRKTVIKRVTSRPLGSLAPGYAATEFGFLVYVNLLIGVGVMLMALGFATEHPWAVIFFALALLGFIAYSIVAIVGEVRTYRALKR